jgi:hypothetical protein
MSTGEVLDRTFNLYRNNFQLFAGIATILSLASLIGALLLVLMGVGVVGAAPPDFRNPASLLLVIFGWLIGYLLFYLIGYALSLGATIYAVSQVHLGNRTTIKESYRRIRPQMWSIINIVVSIFLRIVGASILAYILIALVAVAAVAAGAAWLAAVLGFCGAVAGVVWVMSIACKYALAVPVCLLEKIKGMAALHRSKELAQGSLFRIFIVLLLVFVLNLAFSLGLQYGGGLIVASIPFAAIAWNLLAGFIASTLSFPISNIAYSLFYYDQRIRKEAFDLQLMMEAVGQTPQGQSAAAAPSIG